MTAPTALITGINGFIASSLARRLLADGWNVSGTVREASDLSLMKDIKRELTLGQYDGTMDSIDSLMTKAKPDIVFHLASCFLVDHKPEQVSDLVNANILFGTQLAEVMNGHGIKKLINTGTAWQHYENAEFDPVNLYSATKQAYKNILQFYYSSDEFQIFTLELFDTYGPKDPRNKLFLYLDQARRGLELHMVPGEQFMNLVYIDDVIEAYIVAADTLMEQMSPCFEAYSIASSESIRLKDLVELYEKLSGGDLDVTWGARPYRRREMMTPWDGGEVLPNWQAKVTLEQGIKQLLS